MVTFLFWNINKKPLEETIARIAQRYDIDVLIFAECDIPVVTLLKQLNADGARYHFAPTIGCEKISIYTQFSDNLKPVLETNRLTVRRLSLSGRREILIAATHFPSKLYWSDSSQASESFELSSLIREAEGQAGHSRTALVGDLNMNPFEDGMVSANGLHAVMSQGIAQRGSRTVQGKAYPFFYNPMWSYLGDVSAGPPGTFYYERAQHVNYFWNMFDQVLLRPDLLEFFAAENLQILTSDGDTTFLTTRGTIDASVASDHLPLLFTLNL